VTTTQRSLILGSLAGLPTHHIRPFTESLRATRFAGRTCIVAGAYSDAELDVLQSSADVVHSVASDYDDFSAALTALLHQFRDRRGLRRLFPPLFTAAARYGREREGLRRWASLEFRLQGLQSLRYLHYLDILEHSPDVDAVMITDLRDVIFQEDPFAEPVRGLEVFLEDESVRLGHDHFNTLWLRELYGGEVVSALKGRPVSCSGTVVGARDAVLGYLTRMVMNIIWRRRPMGARDQGVHNALVHGGELPEARIVPNEHGRVITVGAMRNLRTNDDGFLINADGAIPAVVHQWDRHAPFVSQLRPFGFLKQDARSV
jgi:hypothetical protein